jgi:hypothetical protein
MYRLYGSSQSPSFRPNPPRTWFAAYFYYFLFLVDWVFKLIQVMFHMQAGLPGFGCFLNICRNFESFHIHSETSGESYIVNKYTTDAGTLDVPIKMCGNFESFCRCMFRNFGK